MSDGGLWASGPSGIPRRPHHAQDRPGILFGITWDMEGLGYGLGYRLGYGRLGIWFGIAFALLLSKSSWPWRLHCACSTWRRLKRSHPQRGWSATWLFWVLLQKESLRTRFLSPPILCWVRASRTFFSKSLRNAHVMFRMLRPVPALV